MLDLARHKWRNVEDFKTMMEVTSKDPTKIIIENPPRAVDKTKMELPKLIKESISDEGMKALIREKMCSSHWSHDQEMMNFWESKHLN
jgi:hypothetical protein